MIIKSSMTIQEIHDTLDKIPPIPKPSVDDLLVAIADAAAHRAVMELVDYGKNDECSKFWN